MTIGWRWINLDALTWVVEKSAKTGVYNVIAGMCCYRFPLSYRYFPSNWPLTVTSKVGAVCPSHRWHVAFYPPMCGKYSTKKNPIRNNTARSSSPLITSLSVICVLRLKIDYRIKQKARHHLFLSAEFPHDLWTRFVCFSRCRLTLV